jgi:uncharacterized repeat protein (TIGR01451 family)
MQAQIVNIPDAEFKALLLSAYSGNNIARNSTGNTVKIDINNDGQIQVSEAAAIWQLNVSGITSASLEGISSFSNLRKLDCSNMYLTTLNVSMLPHLKELICNESNVTSVDVSGLIDLEIFFCNWCFLTELDLTGLSALKEVDCRQNYSGLAGTYLTSLILSGNSNLEKLDCFGNKITSLNVTGLPNLKRLNCASNNISSVIDLSGSPLIEFVAISDNQIPDIHISDKPNLQSFYCNTNQLVELDFGQMPLLQSLLCGDNHLTSLDLSECPQILSVDASGNDLAYIDLKNGNTSMGSLSLSNGQGQDYVNICIDEGEQQFVMDSYPIAAQSDINISTYCTFTPGGNYNVITGSLFFDNEGDGCDTNDTVIGNIKVNINDGTETGSMISTVGLYEFFTQAGTFTITPDFDNDLFIITPPFAEVNFTVVDSIVSTQNFCLTPNGNHPDVDIVIVPTGASPGFDAGYRIHYRNRGNQTLSGTIVFNYQEDVLDHLWSNPAEASSAPGTLTWNYTGLAPFEEREIYVEMNVNGPMETPPINIDDILSFTVTIDPVSGDDSPGDNVFGLNETVIGSLDPNDITCLEGKSVNPDKIGEYLHYNINFENTGTAPATFIVVKDVIDTAQFDIASLQMINASHPIQAKVTGNKIEFRFDEINLGPQEKGNVVFKIKTLNTLHANDDVTQKADIFFDYNWPIATNDATTVFEVLSRGDFEKDNTVKVYPNPSNGIVNIKATSEIKSVELYDVQGRLLQSGSNASLDISGRTAGMYFVKVRTEAGMKVEKIMKK